MFPPHALAISQVHDINADNYDFRSQKILKKTKLFTIEECLYHLLNVF